MAASELSFDSNIVSALIQVAGTVGAGWWIAQKINIRSNSDVKCREMIASILGDFEGSIGRLRISGIAYLQSPTSDSLRVWKQQVTESNNVGSLVKSVCEIAYPQEKGKPFRELIEAYFALKRNIEETPAWTSRSAAIQPDLAAVNRKFSAYLVQIHRCKFAVYATSPPNLPAS
jgi:hypothetical protein